MLSAVVLGVGLGIGLWAVAVGCSPPAPGLGAVLASATPDRPPRPLPSIIDPGLDTAPSSPVGRPVVTALQAMGLPGARVRRDLLIVGRPVSLHLAEQAVLAVAGLVTPMLLGLVLSLAEVSVGLTVPAVVGLLLAAIGFLLPPLRARREAAARRRGFRHALSAYLDLVWIALAGGAGVDGALTATAALGRGWSFEQIRRALDVARLTRTTPWLTLRQLGDELEVTELAEVAASVSLAGTEGAKVRASLAAKAAAVRMHQLTEAEGDAHAATERMSLPVVILFLGYLTFLAFPALTQVLTGW